MSNFKVQVVENAATLSFDARLTTRSGQIFYGKGRTKQEAHDAAIKAFSDAVREKNAKAAETPKVIGYRKLSDAQIALMNKIKTKGAELGELVAELQSTDELDQRAIAIGKTEVQTGLMWLVRGVAQPESF